MCRPWRPSAAMLWYCTRGSRWVNVAIRTLWYLRVRRDRDSTEMLLQCHQHVTIIMLHTDYVWQSTSSKRHVHTKMWFHFGIWWHFIRVVCTNTHPSEILEAFSHSFLPRFHMFWHKWATPNLYETNDTTKLSSSCTRPPVSETCPTPWQAQCFGAKYSALEEHFSLEVLTITSGSSGAGKTIVNGTRASGRGVVSELVLIIVFSLLREHIHT